VSDTTMITNGLIDPLTPLGFPVSAGVVLQDGRRLYAIFDVRSRRVMIVGHPVRQGNMTAVALSPWTSARPPTAGDLLDELIDPRHADGMRVALDLLRNGTL
jgi:hypothetical protein